MDSKAKKVEEKKGFDKYGVPVKSLPVHKAYTVDPPRYGDARGYFQEIYNATKYPALNIRQVSISKSSKNVLRGLHCSAYAKMVQVVQGSIYDVFVDLKPDSPTFGKWTGKVLSEDNKAQMYIPARCGHGFFSLEDNSKILYLQEGCYNPPMEINLSPFDKTVGVEWPKPIGENAEYNLSQKDIDAPSLKEILPKLKLLAAAERYGSTVDFVVMGKTGFFGQTVIKCLEEQKLNYAVLPREVRMENRKLLGEYLDMWKPKYFINCAGTAGKSGLSAISWCEKNKEETVDANVTGQLNVIEECRKRNIHCTIFGTGCIYGYDKDHPQGSGKGFTEEDKPNFSGNIYSKLRLILEELVKNYDNVLLLRPNYPLSSNLNPKSLLFKLLKYPKIFSVPYSLTVVDDMFPLIPKMCQKGLTGTFNFTSPGVITNGDIMRMYQKMVDSKHQFTEIVQEPSTEPRGMGELSMKKLKTHFPDIPSIKKSVEGVMLRLKEIRDKELKSK